MLNEVSVNSQIYNTKPIIKAFTKDGTEVKISEVILDINTGGIITIVDESGHEYICNCLDVCTDFLEVPGVGFLKPGTKVHLSGEGEYILKHGEHTNISNQTMIGWYLDPTGALCKLDPLGRVCGESRTLYKEMINRIDLVTV